MSAKATQVTHESIEKGIQTLLISERDDDILTRPRGEAHLFDSEEGTALCGNPGTANHYRVPLPEARHDAHPVGDTGTCGNCSRVLRSRIADGEVSSGDGTIDLLMCSEPGDELEVQTGGETQRLVVESVEYSHGRIRVQGQQADPNTDQCEYYTAKMTVTLIPGGTPSAVVGGDLLEDRSHDEATVQPFD